MRVVWFLPVDHFDYDNMSASVWIRALQLIPFLEKLGVESFINDQNIEADISIFVRRQDASTFTIATQQKLRGQKVIFDLCVNYFDVSAAPGMENPVTEKHVNECRKMTDLADAITCASKNIALRAADFNDDVHYIPDSIDHHHFKYRKNTQDFDRKNLTLAWSGVSRKAVELEPYLLDRRTKNFNVHLISNRIPPLTYKRLLNGLFSSRYSKWRYKDFPKKTLTGDICFAPRDINASYNKGHSFFKIGVFLAQGIPVIASPVPSYSELLDDRPCGILCDSKDQFYSALNNIQENRDYLKLWSENGINIMKAYYTEKIAGTYHELFTKL